MNIIQKSLQKMTGVKQGRFDSDKERLYSACKTLTFMLNSIVEEVEKAEMTNEQFFIDFLDTINEISVKY